VKLAASILLLTILSFNWVGYRFVSQYLENRADEEVQINISNHAYDESNLIELRVTLNTPYYSGTKEFESVAGEIELDGVHYNYVKRKIENGELVLLCLPNENKTRFQNSRIDYFKMVNDLDNSSSKKEKTTASSFKTFTTEYSQEKNVWAIEPFIPVKTLHLCADDNNQSAGFLSTQKQPPRI